MASVDEGGGAELFKTVVNNVGHENELWRAKGTVMRDVDED